MTPQEIFTEATSVYDNYVEVLETGSVEALHHYARDLSERIIPRGVETHEVVGIVLLLRDVLARSLFEKYQRRLRRCSTACSTRTSRRRTGSRTPSRCSFVEERERIIRQQEDAMRELSTPVLQVRERLLILPIIGVLDNQRARPAHRAAPRRDPPAPGQGRRHRHHRRARRRRRRWPTTWCRPSTRPG